VSYISVNLFKKVIDYALQEGMSPEKFNILKTPIEKLDEVSVVPADHFFELHEVVDEELGPGFSVRVGQQMQIEDYGVLGMSWKTCSYAGEIFERSERYFKLLSDTYVFKVIKDKVYSRVLLLREPTRRGMELSNEATLSATVVVLKIMTESDISPVEVTFKHKAPKDLLSYQNAFSCQLKFGEAYYSITYQTADFEKRTTKADRDINQFLLERVEEEAKGIKIDSNKIVEQVENIVIDSLPSGIPSINRVGEQMGMSNRTLTRRLAESNFSFRDIIRNTQELRAKHLLRNTNRSVAEVAFEIGFSEQSAFNRAFKRWTNLSPSQFRKNPQ